MQPNTNTVRAAVGVPVAFGEFNPTAEFRWLRSGNTRRLQQAWHAYGVDGLGAVCAGKTEWRDVPTVEDNKSRFDKIVSRAAKARKST